jgi:hypothetical protein
MPGDLRGVRLKLERAATHRHELRTYLEHPDGTGFFRLVVKDLSQDQGSWQYELLAKRYRDDRPVSALLGDFVHNLRSSLDHLVWQLVIANGGQPTSRNAFPIFPDARAFAGRRPGDLGGVADEPIRFIEGIQPFQPNWSYDARIHPLWILHALDVTDKHRLLNTMSLHAASGTLDLPRDAYEVVQIVNLNDLPIEDGTVIARIRSKTPPPLGPDTSLQTRIMIEGNDLMPAVDLGALDGMTGMVTSIINEMASHFFD